MSSTIQNTFSLLVPAHIKTVDILGSWNNYAQRYSMLPDPTRGPGNFILTVKFTSTGAPRYWYYYILDGYFESHDPNEPVTVEPTRGIKLNILDASYSGYSSSGSSGSVSPVDSDHYSSSSATSLSSSSPDAYKDYYRAHSPTSDSDSGPVLLQPIPQRTDAKLSLDTNFDRYSMITTAATISDSPGGYSSQGSRGTSPTGSICSSCSNTSFEEDSSPGTPICTCAGRVGHPTSMRCPSPGALRYKPRLMAGVGYGSDGDDEGSSDSDSGSLPKTRVRLSRGAPRMAAKDAWELEQATRALRLH